MNNGANQPYQNQPVQGNPPRQYPPQSGYPQKQRPNGGYRPKKKKNRGIGWQLFKLLLILLLLGAAGAGIYAGKTYIDVAPYTSVFLDGVTVDGIDLGGMTWEEGTAAVNKQISEELDSWYIRLKNENGYYPDITAETLGISSDPTDALEAAWAVGHTADDNGRVTIFDLKDDIVAAQSGTYSFSSVDYNADTSVIDTILAQLETAAYVAPQDAAMLSFNPDSSSEPFTFQEEVVGRKLKTDTLKAEILDMITNFQSGELTLETETIQPNVTLADIEPYYTLLCRATTPIDSSSSDARNENIRIAFSKINGLELEDGDKFSFNSVVGRRTQTNGFLFAYEYNYGDLVWGIGGGVCQSSTTVYLAAMKSGMTLVKHTAHSQKVSYTDLGLDATVSDTVGAERDMVFRNDSGSTIYIAAHVITDPSNKKRLLCEVRIYGMDLGDISYDLQTEIVQVLEPSSTPTYIDDDDAKYVTYTDEIYSYSDAAEGYVVDTYRITLQNGTEISREKLARSTYPARAAKIYQGVTPRY